MTQQLRDQLQATLSGSYTIERELGGGGMSKVFVAEETRLRRKVVVKVLSPELAQGISVERFEREIQTAAALQQANIVPILSAGDTNGLPFYTMPFVDGESLRARLGRGPLPVTEVIGVLRDVSKALAYAHQHGVVHRDIKPDNVLISGGTAVVTDFGIAKAISAARTSSGNATLTQIGTSIGTPAYMSPEQAAGDPQIDHRADIYSLGAMAYELLSGQAVFANRTPQRMLAAHMGETPKSITDFRADLPPALADMVMRCLAKEAADRPQQASDIARTLETITSGSGMQSMPPVLMGGPGMFRKALAIYAAAFVVVAVVAKAAIVGIGLPDWVFAGSLIVMALGLPVVLWTGYVQRVTRRAMAMTPTYTPGGSPSVAGGTIATMALKAAPHVSWYKTARGGMYAFGVFIVIIGAFMGMRAFGIGPAASLITSGKFGQRDRVIIADFSVRGGDSTLAAALTQALRSDFEQSSAVSVLPVSAVGGALARMRLPQSTPVTVATARDLAVREGLKGVVAGEAATLGQGFLVTLRLVNATTGDAMASYSVTAESAAKLIDAIDGAARKLRGKIGESLKTVNSMVPLYYATTASFEALAKYSEAERVSAFGGDYIRAAALLEDAVRFDSTFALAYRKLYLAYGNAAINPSRALWAIERAFALRDRVPAYERLIIEGTYFRGAVHLDRIRAAEAFTKAWQLDSVSSISPANQMGQIAVSRGDWKDVERWARAEVNSAPDISFGHTDLTQALAVQGNYRGADSALRAATARFPNNPRLVFSAFMVSGMSRLPDSAAAAVRPYLASPNATTRLAARAFVATASCTAGRVRDCVRIGDEGIAGLLAGASTAGDTLGVGRDRSIRDLNIPVRHAIGVKAADSVLALMVARNVPPANRGYLALASTLAFSGEAKRARQLLTAYDAELRDTTRRRAETVARRNVLGEVLLAEGNGRGALEEFRAADTAPDGPTTGCRGCYHERMARAFDAAQMPDSAVAEFEAYTAATDLGTLTRDAVALPAVYFRLAELHEAKGDVSKAAEHYRKFIDLWKGADPDLQPRVAEARRRLAKLAPVEKPR